jgi:Domain of unknown function (DUF6997)/Domain of unknown function (DUF6996)
MPNETPTNKAWEKIFDKLGAKERIAESGILRITANQIKQISAREPRLMTKFDSRKTRPKLLVDQGLTILPTSNGEYVLLCGDGYSDIPPVRQAETYDPGKIKNLQTIRLGEGIRSESQAIDTLFMISALRSFVGDDSLQLTVRGRLRSGDFSFKFRTNVRQEIINVKGVQIEVDSGYEGKKIAIVEAKFGSSESFIIRQLYYPYRELIRSGVTKEIVPVLLVYSNLIYSLYAFSFQREDDYQSINLLRQADFILGDLDTPPRLIDFVTTKRAEPPAEIPFPQADDLTKVIDVTDILASTPADKDQIAERFQVDPRQGDYYANAAAWLGLAEKSKGRFQLTKAGIQFNKLSRVKRIEELASLLAEMPGFAEAIGEVAKGNPIDNDEIARIIDKVYGYSGTTKSRRALTVRSWAQYLANTLKK